MCGPNDVESAESGIDRQRTRTAEITWNSLSNPASPIDCTENIIAHYDILVERAADFLFMTDDPVSQSTPVNFRKYWRRLAGFVRHADHQVRPPAWLSGAKLRETAPCKASDA